MEGFEGVGKNQDLTTWSRDFGEAPEDEGVRRRGEEEGEVEGRERIEERGRKFGDETKADIAVDGGGKGAADAGRRRRQEVRNVWGLHA